MFSRSAGSSRRPRLSTFVLLASGLAAGAGASPLTEPEPARPFDLAVNCIYGATACRQVSWAQPIEKQANATGGSLLFDRAGPSVLGVVIPPGDQMAMPLALAMSAVARENTDASGDHGAARHRVAEAPLPTAVWLFGSALIALLIFGRQRRQY